MVMEDRRTQRRPQVHFPAELRARSNGHQGRAFYGRVECQACDVSKSGARLIALSEELVPEGASVIIKIKPARFRRSYALKGTVRWGRATRDESMHICGVEFDGAHSRSTYRWQRFMKRFLKKRGIDA
ncbi:MAG: PilZ domain-containing protein [Kiritimatiellae bacterium]|nr:PilZ domain-containing protein [Kiritimatiellia bacterium]